LDQTGDYSFEAIFSPRIGLSIALRSDLHLYANVSHGFSPPTLSETLTPDGLINPDIKPETGFNYELGSRGKAAGQRLFYDVSIYSMQVSNLLVAERVGDDAFVGVNAGRTSHNGFESNLVYSLLKAGSLMDKYLDLFLTYTYANYKFKDFINDGEDFSGNQLTGTPRNVLNTGLDLAVAGIYGNLNYQFVDQIPITDDNSVFSDSYSLLNLKLGYRKKLGSNFKIDVYGGVNNVADEMYASMLLVNAGGFGGRAPRYYYPGLPRNYYGGIMLALFINKPLE
jgi:iron complex outermembrane receptor protein